MLLHGLGGQFQHARLNVHGNHAAGGPRGLRQTPGEVAGAGAQIRDGHPLANREGADERVGLLFGIPFGSAEKLDVFGGRRNLAAALPRLARRDGAQRPEVGDQVLDLRGGEHGGVRGHRRRKPPALLRSRIHE